MSTIEEVSNTKRRVSLEISAEDATKAFNEAYEYYAKSVTVKGFRPGKIPKAVVLKQCNAQIRKRVLETLISDRVHKAIKEHDLVSLSAPIVEKFTLVEGEPTICVATFDVYPTFEFPDLSTLEVPKRPIFIPEDAVDQLLEVTREKQSSIRTVEEDRPTQDGDILEVTYQIYHENKLMAMKKGEKTAISITLGQPNKFFPEIVSAVTGARAGETVEANVELPKDHPFRNVAGKLVTFRLTINSVRVREMPDLDDEFAKDTGYPDVTDLASLKDYLLKIYKTQLEDDSRNDFHYALLAKIAEATKIELPESILESETQSVLKKYRANLAKHYKDQPIEHLLNNEYAAHARADAVSNLTQEAILEKVIQTQEITVTDEDMDKELTLISFVTGHPVMELRRVYKDDANAQALKSKILNTKALDYLTSQVKVVEAPLPSQNDLEPIIQEPQLESQRAE
ncbi:MAG: trigger factor [Deltaproteobacteria bacterium]|nr:trigger factor [Deltaproteobacteria bacterium]